MVNFVPCPNAELQQLKINDRKLKTPTKHEKPKADTPLLSGFHVEGTVEQTLQPSRPMHHANDLHVDPLNAVKHQVIIHD